MPVGCWQLADVLGPVAHYPGEVACVVQAAHDDTVQVHGLNEMAKEGTLQAQHVPPGRRGEESALTWVEGRGQPQVPSRLRLDLCRGLKPLPSTASCSVTVPSMQTDGVGAAGCCRHKELSPVWLLLVLSP